ncbi:MAG: hypothetical protein OXP09_05005, partial [Gammaproteobacteria bacterium]|nr:hypothetical protein [Gammaproteobacteria bacterium]
HGHIILLHSMFSDELNAPKGKRRIRTLSRVSALFLARPRPGAPEIDGLSHRVIAVPPAL